MSGAVDLAGLKAKEQPSAGGSTATSVELTEANFEAEALQRSTQVPVVVALASSRSPASLELVDVLERMAARDGGRWVLGKVDVDADMRIAQAFGVQAVPTVVAVAAGQPLADFQGGQGEPQLRQWIDAVLDAVKGRLSGPSQSEPEPQQPEDARFTAAEDALERGDFAAAESAYTSILDDQPDNAEAQGALRQVRFLARAHTVADDAVAAADAAPSDVDAQLAAADAEVLAQQPGQAFERLIATVKRTAGDDRTRVRTRLLELFELFDPAEPFVVAARRKLATALY